MGNEQSQYNERDMDKKVMKWSAELEHVRELNKMLSSERKIVTTNLEQELYDKQLKLYYLGKSATKHIGFRGYLKIINKVSPKTQADFMASTSYDPKKKVPNKTTAMVLRSAILNFSLFSLFEAWLLKRMHFVSIQKHQRRLHQKGWKFIVAFYSEEIPMIQETFSKQEPGLRQKVDQGKKENMDLLEEYENKIFQQEEEIIALRKCLEESGVIDNSARQDNIGSSTLDKAFPDENPGNANARGFARFRSKAMTPIQAMIQKRERASMEANSGQDKAWRADNNRTWGAPDTGSEDESLYMDDEILHTDQVIKFGTNDKIEASERHDIPNDKLKGPEIVYTNFKSDMSAITIPNTVMRSDGSTSDSLDGSVKASPKAETDELALDESLGKIDLQTLPSTTSVSSDTKGSLGSGFPKKQARDKDAIREEYERLEKAKSERHKRASMERQERESFYKQERERLKHQERRLTMKREESTRLRQEKSVDGDEISEHSDCHLSVTETDYDLEEDLKDEPLDSLREVDREYETTDDEKFPNSDHNFDGDDDDSDVLQERPGSRKDFTSGVDSDGGEGGEESNDKSLMSSPGRHLSVNGGDLKEEKMNRRKMWQVDKAESDRELSCDDGDSIENELKRLNEFETVINVSDEEEIAASNISSDFKLLRSSSGRNLMEQGERASSRSPSRTRARSRSRARALSPGRTPSALEESDARQTDEMDDPEKLPDHAGMDSKSLDQSNRSNGMKPASSASLDASNRSKQSKSRSRRKLKDHFLDISVQSDDISTFSKKSAGSKSSRGTKGRRKKKKTGESRRKLKDPETASYDEDSEVVAIKKKKRRGKKKKQSGEDHSLADSYSGDDDKSVTSALTTNSYE